MDMDSRRAFTCGGMGGLGERKARALIEPFAIPERGAERDLAAVGDMVRTRPVM
jgi:hypothetical protein